MRTSRTLFLWMRLLVIALLGLLGASAMAVEVTATYSYEGDRLPSAAGWTDEGLESWSTFAQITTADGEEAIYWDGAVDIRAKLVMDPTAIPGLPLGGAGDFTYEIRHIGAHQDQWYQSHLNTKLITPGGARWDIYPVGTWEGFNSTRGSIKDGNYSDLFAVRDAERNNMMHGAPSAAQDNWAVTRLVNDWLDADGDLSEDDLHIRWLVKPPGDTAWTVVGDVTVHDVVGAIDDYRWSIVSHANVDGPRYIEVWVDYVRWVDEALADDVNLVPVPEPATMGLLAFGGLALLRRRK